MFLRRFCLVVRCFFTKLGLGPVTRARPHTGSDDGWDDTLAGFAFTEGVWVCTSSDERSLVREAEAT